MASIITSFPLVSRARTRPRPCRQPAPCPGCPGPPPPQHDDLIPLLGSECQVAPLGIGARRTSQRGGAKELPTWGSGSTTVALGPELLRRVGVGWMCPDLGCLAVPDVDDLDHIVLIQLARPFGADRSERDGVVIVSEHVVQLETGRAA